MNSEPSPLNRFGPLRVNDLFTLVPAMERCLKLAALAAQSDVPILILGETGTGKTLLAQAIHNSSPRARGRFVSFNASAMSDTLIESQLFGHERGAFTGAQRELKGKFELAHQGSLFLDEIADMSPLAQAKILRAVEYGEFERLGSERMLHSNARIISATHVKLRDRIRANLFREDLLHRLAGLTLMIPALRDRREDLPALIASELETLAVAAKKPIDSIHPEALDRLLRYDWPGNLRELHHTLRTVVLLCSGTEVLPDHVLFQPDLFDLGHSIPQEHKGHSFSHDPAPCPLENGATIGSGSHVPHSSDETQDLSLEAVVQSHVLRVYETAGRNQRKTAKLLAISRSTLARHLESVRAPKG